MEIFKNFINCKVLVSKNTGINGGKSFMKNWISAGFDENEVSFYHDIIENEKSVGTMIYLKNGQIFHTDLIKKD